MPDDIMANGKRQRLLSEARDHVRRIRSDRSDIVAAYVDGSAARDEMIPGSDVDVGIVVDRESVPFYVSRRIVLGTVMEWCFVGKGQYGDIESILDDAGFVHDLLTSYVLFDPSGWFTNVKSKIRVQYDKPEEILRRAHKLYQNAGDAYERLKSAFRDGKELLAGQRALVKQLRPLLSIPQALLNRPLTNARALMVCQRACQTLDCPGYYHLLLSIFGAADIDASRAKELYSMSLRLNDLAWPSRDETEIIRLKLASAQYLIDCGRPEQAIWPLYFWIGWTVEQVSNETGANIVQVKRLWQDFADRLGWSDLSGIRERLDLIEEALARARVIIDHARPQQSGNLFAR